MSTTVTYDFASSSLEDWMKVVQKDLKEKPYEALTSVVDGDIVLEPINHLDGMDARGKVLSDQQHRWSTGLFVSESSSNDLVLSSLENGVDTLVLEAFGDEATYLRVFNGVEPTFINWMVTIKAGQEVSILKDWFGVQQVAITFRIVGNDQHELLLFALQQFPTAKFAVSTPFVAGEYSQNMVRQIAAVDAFLRYANAKSFASTSDLLMHVVFETVLSNNFLVEIAHLRAFHLIWKNYLKAFNAPTFDAALLVGFDQHCLLEDRDTNLIQLTTMVMSAVLGGANVVLTIPRPLEQGQHDAEAIRLSINIQMMLKMESYFDKVADPYAGSYFVEKLTQKLGSKVWNQLKTQLHD